MIAWCVQGRSERSSMPLSFYRVIFLTGPTLKVLSAIKLISARLGVSRTIYVNVVGTFIFDV